MLLKKFLAYLPKLYEQAHTRSRFAVGTRSHKNTDATNKPTATVSAVQRHDRPHLRNRDTHKRKPKLALTLIVGVIYVRRGSFIAARQTIPGSLCSFSTVVYKENKTRKNSTLFFPNLLILHLL